MKTFYKIVFALIIVFTLFVIFNWEESKAAFWEGYNSVPMDTMR